MLNTLWEVAVIEPSEGRTAQVTWNAVRRLPPELIPLALNLGYSEKELSSYAIGELTEDVVIGEDLFLKGALVIPDEDGLPAALFGKPLLGKSWRASNGSIR
jgi:hypothetical protein